MSRRQDQAKTYITTIEATVKSQGFKCGFYEYLSGLPFNPDYNVSREVWNYERGRQFAAAIGQPMNLKSAVAVKYFKELFAQKAIR